MQDKFLIEVFSREYRFVSRSVAATQKYERDYISLGTNEVKVLGNIEANKRDYIQIHTGETILQGIITSVKKEKLETKIKYKDLLSIFDVEAYKDRILLKEMSLEKFIGELIEETYVKNADGFQNIQGLEIEYLSETRNAALYLKENLHNIYELIMKAFRRYGVVVYMRLDVMKKKIYCSIGRKVTEPYGIEADLQNILDVTITLKDDEESVNKVIVIGEYDNEELESYGKTIKRVYYLDKDTGETTQTPTERVLPVVQEIRVISVDEETFENDAYEAAYEVMYQEENDNSIKIKVGRDDLRHKVENLSIGQKCIVMRGGEKYSTVYTGCVFDKTITLLFGMVRTEYTKRRRKV